uniref:CDKN1A interacting zinc finger protein 1 n=1 Tax=Capra hircus TaxID=9925 RepID=A0A452DVP3_CAPHI
GLGLPQQQPQQQLLTLQGTSPTSLLNGSVLQRALLLQQLQGMAAGSLNLIQATHCNPPSSLFSPTGNLRGYNLATPNLTPPSLTPPQLATPNLQQFFPQATRQSLLGPPPVGVPINPSQLNLSGRTPQKQARTSSSTTPNRKVSGVWVRSRCGWERTYLGIHQHPLQLTLALGLILALSKRTPALEPESCEASEPPAKKSKSSEEPTEKGPPGQLQAEVQLQTRMMAPKQTQTPELLPEPLEAQVQPQFQPRVLQITVQPKLQKQAQTQTSPEHLAPQQQPPTQPLGQLLVQPPEPAQGRPQTQPQASVPVLEKAPVPVRSTALETLPDTHAPVISGPEEAPPEPRGAQVSMEESQEELTGGLDVAECEKRAREMLGVWGAGGSLKVTILQSSDSRAFSTVPLTPGPRAGDSTSATPMAASTPSKQALQFFCYICKAGCSSQQEFQEHMSGAQHQQRLGEIQHMSQAYLLSLLPVPRDVLEREDEEPPPRRWCNTCQLYYMGDLIQHRRTQGHKLAKQSLRPFCTICNRYFKTPRKFVEHVKSQGHKDKAKELKTLEKDVASQDEDLFITVDAVGCFEGDEEEEEDDEEEEEIEVEEEFHKQVRGEGRHQAGVGIPCCASGVDFLVPVMGYVCRVCHKFYHSNSGAQLSHCKSLAHFENLQKYKKAKKPSPTTRPVSRRCAINARNALTALFTSGGRPSTQDTAKNPSKVTPTPPRPPLPRRSRRLRT